MYTSVTTGLPLDAAYVEFQKDHPGVPEETIRRKWIYELGYEGRCAYERSKGYPYRQ